MIVDYINGEGNVSFTVYQHATSTIIDWNNARVKLGEIPEFNINILETVVEEIEKITKKLQELSLNAAILEDSLRSQEFKLAKLGSVIDNRDQPDFYPPRKSLATSDIGSTARSVLLADSISRSTLEQLTNTYQAAGIEAWREDISICFPNIYQSGLLDKLAADSTNNPTIKEMWNVCVQLIKENPKIIEEEIVYKINNILASNAETNRTDKLGLPLPRTLTEEINHIKYEVELFKPQTSNLLNLLLKPLLYPKDNSLGGLGAMNTGTCERDFVKLFKLIRYFEYITNSEQDIKKIGEALFEKALSTSGTVPATNLPLVESFEYLVQIPEGFYLDIQNIHFVKNYAENGKFDTILLIHLNKLLITGGGIIHGFNSSFMQRFCIKYEEYINFDHPHLVTLIDIIKSRDEENQVLLNLSPKEILLNSEYRRQLYSLATKYGSSTDQNLLELIKNLSNEI